MPLKPGSRLGPYEICALLGAGGMGEVYRARDARLGRDVALKVVLAGFESDASFRLRFEQEARAVAALNHPNIVVVYDVGPGYIVSELVDGVVLRKLGPQPLRHTLELAAQIAEGLAAAHSIGIVHRDVKPENVMVTKDGRAKILDFGIAKRDFSASEVGAAAMVATQPGMVMGTASYMSPEQIRGLPLDRRSDIFSLGLVLHEMLTGRKAFSADSAAEVMSAILKDDPPPLPPSVPPSVAVLVSHCLEKDPNRRCESARDLSVSLRALSTGSQPLQPISAPPAKPKRTRARLLAAAGMLLALAAGLAAGWWANRTELPSYRQVTFQRGFVSAGRFTTSGDNIVYSAQWNAEPADLFSAHISAPEARALGLRGAHLFSLSKHEELAVALECRFIGGNSQMGTLAVLPLQGGSPRILLTGVSEADWDPEGSGLAVVHTVDGMQRLEYPVGRVLYRTAHWIGDLRFSPQGGRIAFSEHPQYGDDRGWIMVTDLAGQRRKLSQEWESVEGLVWASGSGEIWYAAAQSGDANTIYAVTLGGKQRVIARFPGGVKLHDLTPGGKLLLAEFNDNRSEMYARLPAETRDRPVDWLGPSFPADLSADGKLLLFSQYGRAVGTNYAVYLRKLDGSLPTRLGEGDAAALSPDGKWAAAVLYFSPPQLALLPTGEGTPRVLPASGVDYQQNLRWLPDSRRIVFAGNEPGHGPRLWLQDTAGGAPVPFTPEGVSFEGDCLSPDAKLAAAKGPDGVLRLYPLAGGAAREAPGLDSSMRLVRWTMDGRKLLVAALSPAPARLYEVDVSSGERKLWKELNPVYPTGVSEITQVLVAADGQTIVYGQNRKIRSLHVVEGLDRRLVRF
ncbi:MAG: protein kinase [Bryobacteraceae bacterium]|jgi:serine/threonine protein kinase/Tol biopolymer transport system component